ncbi:hypothetical protein [Pseudarthrobacter oxydans]|uniref:hypothetical protein n=1 Tax=Pseudarthrobacter oxydans TaxID=1671 RepID=UPI003412DA82
MTFDETPLFSFGDDAEPATESIREMPIKAEQVKDLERAFAEAGMATAQSQRDIIASCVVRPFESLNDLLAKDYRPILRRIEERGTPLKNSGGSAWDNREGDTWIDKL